MKGYKGFKKGLICRGKQYSENAIFEEESAEICKCGMHFCKNPLDVLDYYPLVDEDGNINEFAEVESLDDCHTDDEKKYCTKKLKIGAKINFPDLVQASVKFDIEKTKELTSDSAQIGSSGDYARIGSSGYNVQIGSSGDSARIGSSGDSAQIGSSGDYARIGSSGYNVQIGSSGDYARIGSSGDSARIGSSGDYAQIGSSGDSAQIGSSGDSARIGSSGYNVQIGSSGYNVRIGSSGDSAQIGSSGDSAQIGSSGKYSVICCAGHNSKVKAKIGSWITLSEWVYDDKAKASIPICVKTVQVDGITIKEDTFYKLENGNFVEIPD